MSSIRWSALFLSLAAPLACAPHYDVADATGGAAGSGGDGVGGSSTTGGSGGGDTGGSSGTNGSGGKSATGGSGGSGEVGGSSAGGTDATGGTGGPSVGGAAGFGGAMMPPLETPPCGEPAEFEYGSLATPEVVWERISHFLFDELRDAPSELPEETTPEWAVEILGEALDRSRLSSISGEAALIPFMQKFLDAEPAAAVGDPPYEYWARVISGSGSRMGDLFDGDEESNPPFGLFGTVAAQYDSISGRGRFLSERLECVTIELPPLEDHPSSLVVEPNQTRRQALSLAISSPVCAGCHAVMDPLGFPLEVLTPGSLEYRTTENGIPIDTSGVTNTGIAFSDLESLGEQLSVSCEVARCLAQQLFEEAVPGGDPSVGPTVQLNNAVYRFAAPDSPAAERFQFQALLEAIVSSPAFLE